GADDHETCHCQLDRRQHRWRKQIEPVRMIQTGDPKESIETIDRLLPGDRAPGLKLARVFNRETPVEQVKFDRLSAVILWNAGCVGCLPAVSEVAELGAAHDMPCYGVAVMVRDVDRTAAAA